MRNNTRTKNTNNFKQMGKGVSEYGDELQIDNCNLIGSDYNSGIN